MSDWKVGDLAVCVDDSPCTVTWLKGAPFGIKAGTVLSVVAVLDRFGKVGLYFAEVENEGDEWDGYAANRFRKIRPDEHEKCEPEFVTLLKRNLVPA